jgi:hypothetical protein
LYVILDLAGSRGLTGEQVDHSLAQMRDLLNAHEDVHLRYPFSSISGDTLHGVATDLDTLAAIAWLAIPTQQWYMSVGIGCYQRYGERSYQIRGLAIKRAQRAILKAKQGFPFLAVDPPNERGIAVEIALTEIVQAEFDLQDPSTGSSPTW